ncbi:MAG: methionyl-tRNA formyltransferase, partial [Candidatus Omnitrophica bacterium]|nr:methionyl-tRNA formyltransferase [Candidatus Omnitrophota bacterium]
AGEIIAQKKVNIGDDDTAPSLEKKLAFLGSDLLLETLEKIVNNQYTLARQDEEKVTLAPLLNKNDGLINWKLAAQKLHDLIRGTQAWPGAFTHYQAKVIKLWESALDLEVAPGKEPGEIIALSKEGILVKTGKDNLLIKQLQPESGKRMSAYDFLQGHKLRTGDKFL